MPEPVIISDCHVLLYPIQVRALIPSDYDSIQLSTNSLSWSKPSELSKIFLNIPKHIKTIILYGNSVQPHDLISIILKFPAHIQHLSLQVNIREVDLIDIVQKLPRHLIEFSLQLYRYRESLKDYTRTYETDNPNTILTHVPQNIKKINLLATAHYWDGSQLTLRSGMSYTYPYSGSNNLYSVSLRRFNKVACYLSVMTCPGLAEHMMRFIFPNFQFSSEEDIDILNRIKLMRASRFNTESCPKKTGRVVLQIDGKNQTATVSQFTQSSRKTQVHDACFQAEGDVQTEGIQTMEVAIAAPQLIDASEQAVEILLSRASSPCNLMAEEHKELAPIKHDVCSQTEMPPPSPLLLNPFLAAHPGQFSKYYLFMWLLAGCTSLLVTHISQHISQVALMGLSFFSPSSSYQPEAGTCQNMGIN